MKKLKYLLLIIGFMFLTSCEVMQYPTYSTSTIDVNFGVYDYNRINYLYMNNYDYFWNTRYINQYGASCYLYQHPHFIRYRNDYYHRHNRHIPHQRSRYTNVRTHRNETVRHNVTRRNTSNERSGYTEPRRTTVNNKPPVIRRSTSTVRRQSTYRPPQQQRTVRSTSPTVRQPVHNQIRRNNQINQPQRRTNIKKRKN